MVESLNAYHCALKNSGLCTLTNVGACAQELPECDKKDACPKTNSPPENTITDESRDAAMTVATVILTLSGIVLVGYFFLLIWTAFQTKLLQQKMLTFDVYDPYDLPETKPKYFIID